ncbi:YtxH domain-containing protein [uncultured Levyella sp.]|uniref:YtxH domain-containing protein n=1 Tax=uncultured Levyella sp. TaxID=1715800 RepID=UPI002590FAC4|nr:YtxH domain-containing protein [uncultured Levyella sp.]
MERFFGYKRIDRKFRHEQEVFCGVAFPGDAGKAEARWRKKRLALMWNVTKKRHKKEFIMAKDFLENAKEKIGDAGKNVGDMGKDVGKKVGDGAEDLKEKAKEGAEDLKEKAKEGVENVKDFFGNIGK